MPYTTIVAGTYTSASWANSDVRDQVVSRFSSTANRDALVGTPLKGMVCVTTDTGTVWIYDGATWVQHGGSSSWTAWTPAVTATTTNPTLGSGGFLTTYGRYFRVGPMVTGWGLIIAGSTSVTAGTGTYMFSLPVNPLAATFSQQLGSANFAAQSPYVGILRLSSDDTTKAAIIINNAAVTAATGAIAANTQIRYHFTYEAA